MVGPYPAPVIVPHPCLSVPDTTPRPGRRLPMCRPQEIGPLATGTWTMTKTYILATEEGGGPGRSQPSRGPETFETSSPASNEGRG